MHGERDIITRLVFPELNQRLKNRNVKVVPIDLRWGLTKEDTSDEGLGALEHCLIEIDRSRPFFVMLSGNRYGWIPPNYRVSDTPQFEWVKHFQPGNISFNYNNYNLNNIINYCNGSISWISKMSFSSNTCILLY